MFNGVYSKNNWTKVKDGGCVTNHDEYKSIGTHWIASYVNDNNMTYSDRFWVKNIPPPKKIHGKQNIIRNIYRIQPYNSIMCVYFCIGFIDFMLKGKGLLDYTNLFPPNDYEKNDKTKIKIFSITKKIKRIILHYLG